MIGLADRTPADEPGQPLTATQALRQINDAELEPAARQKAEVAALLADIDACLRLRMEARDAASRLADAIGDGAIGVARMRDEAGMILTVHAALDAVHYLARLTEDPLGRLLTVGYGDLARPAVRYALAEAYLKREATHGD